MLVTQAPHPAHRVLRWVGPVVGILIAIWTSWGVWEARRCTASCTPAPDSSRVRLASGATLPLLYRNLIDGTLHLKYATGIDVREHERVCDEAQAVFQGLASSGELGSVSEVMLSPTDLRVRIEGWTWRGPILSCCVSPGFAFSKGATGDWPAEPIGCGG
jgi:hypothetical protein